MRTGVNDELLKRAEPILERYRSALLTKGSFESALLERELREVWDVGYKDLKPLVYTMLQHGRFEEVAAYYMEHSNAPGVVKEFQPHLAALYGITHYNAPDREEKRKQFWGRVFGAKD